MRVEKDLAVLYNKRTKRNGSLYSGNLTPQKTSALKELKSKNNLVIKKSDKGGPVVVMDASLYKKQALLILDNRNTSRTLANDPTLVFKEI